MKLVNFCKNIFIVSIYVFIVEPQRSVILKLLNSENDWTLIKDRQSAAYFIIMSHPIWPRDTAVSGATCDFSFHRSFVTGNRLDIGSIA